MTSFTRFACILLVAVEIIFIPLYLKKMWPTKNWHSLGYKMVCATAYVLIALMLAIESGGFNRYSLLMFIGFICSWIGDLNLHIPKPTKKFFVIGMFFFMTAHVFYCLAYIHIQKMFFADVPPVLWWEVAFCTAFLIVYFTVCMIKKVNFGAMMLPSMVYGFSVAMMMIKACSLAVRLIIGGFSNMLIPSVLLILGGICFLLSDATLALISFDTRYKKFRLKVFNIVTYFP
ncbi:MAG: hypothetical protein IIW48_09835, partial [Clostridia bacterium]|nr:hypothetical protein [Clostridia bacterium]